MTTNQLTTVAAIAFAGFALWYITRKPGAAVAAQPGQQQRDLGLQAWYGLRSDQNYFSTDAFNYSGAQLPNVLGY